MSRVICAGIKGETMVGKGVKSGKKSHKSDVERKRGKASKAFPSGLALFRSQFFNQDEGVKGGNAIVHNDDVIKAWTALTNEGRMKFIDEAKKSRPPKKMAKRNTTFLTRCSPWQFKQLVDYVNTHDALKERVIGLGFGKLLELKGCMKLPHDLIVSMIHAYDPPTHQFRIRGNTREISALDVHQLLGVPYGGAEVISSVPDDDPLYIELRTQYSNRLYKNILAMIGDGVGNGNFELLFMVYTLGTFLSPTASGKVSNRVLKVVACTMKSFKDFDWSTFIINELWKEMKDFLRDCRNRKSNNSNVGGCVYLLLIYFAEHFSLLTSGKHAYADALTHWTDVEIKKMVQLERDSNMGIIFGLKACPSEVVTERNIGIGHLDPDLKDLYNRLTTMIGVELIKEQLKRGGQHKVVGETSRIPQLCSTRRGDDQVPAADEEEGSGRGDGDTPNDRQDESGASDFSNKEHIIVSDGMAEGGEIVEKERADIGDVPRRSTRVRKEKKIESPYVMPKVLKRKKEVDDKEKLFNIISRWPSSNEGKTLVAIN